MSVRDEWVKAHIDVRKREFADMLDHYLGELSDDAAAVAQSKAWILGAFENRDWVIVHKEVLDQ